MPIPAFAPALRPALVEPCHAGVGAEIDTEDVDAVLLSLEAGRVAVPSVVVVGVVASGTMPADISFASHSTLYGSCQAVPNGIAVF
jgi:hypothetical protein